MRRQSSLRLGLWLAAGLPLLSSCGAASGPARTVSYFQAHPQERAAVFKRCANDPGTLEKTPECVNATRAEEIAAIGSFGHLPPMRFPSPSARGTKKALAPAGGANGPQR